EEVFRAHARPARGGGERSVGELFATRGLVVGADVLAGVAAEEPVARGLAVRLGVGAAVLDRDVAQAAPGIDRARLEEGAGGAGVEAEAAAPAAARERHVGLELGAR